MRAIAVETCLKKGKTDVLHHYLFHGIAHEDENRPGTSPGHFLGDDLKIPTVVDKSGLIFPRIIKPCKSLVVDSVIKKRLEKFGEVQVSPVKLGKLVASWFPAGDFSYYDNPSFLKDPYTFRSDLILERLPDTPSLHKNAPNYFELLSVNSFRAAQGTSKLISIHFEFPEKGLLGVNDFDYCSGMLEKYPIIWGCAPIIRQDVFDQIWDGFDWDFFAMTEIII